MADDKLNNLENLVLLQHFTRDVEWQISRVHDPLHEVEVLGNELFAVFHD